MSSETTCPAEHFFSGGVLAVNSVFDDCRAIQIAHFVLGDFWWVLIFKTFIYFFEVEEFVNISLFTVSPCYLFNDHRICSSSPFVTCVFTIFVGLVVGLSILLVFS